MSQQGLLRGYLWIKSKNNKWKRRYFVVYDDDRAVEYYKNELQSYSRSNAQGGINLMQMEKIAFVKNNNRKSHWLSSCTRRHVSKPLNGSKTTINGWSMYQSEKVEMDLSQLSDQSSSATSDYSPVPMKNKLSAIDESTSKTPKFSMFHSDSVLYTKKHRRSVFFQSDDENHDSENEEACTFRTILENSWLDIKCERDYTFALVSNTQIFELSAETTEDAKNWVMLLYKLCQGKKVYDGYLNEKYYVLHANKVLNCYNNKYQIEQDIDLRHCLFIKYDESSNANEINLGMRSNDKKKQLICLKTENRSMATEWFKQIKALFGDNESFKQLHHSKCQNINIIHNESQLKHRFIAMYRRHLVIFPNKKQFESVTKMTFFNKQIFGDMLRREKCILIPLHKQTKIRNASRFHGKYAFLISDAEGDRKWYFTFSSWHIFSGWVRALCAKHRIRPKKSRPIKRTRRYSIDIEVESSISSTSSSIFQ